MLSLFWRNNVFPSKNLFLSLKSCQLRLLNIKRTRTLGASRPRTLAIYLFYQNFSVLLSSPESPFFDFHMRTWVNPAFLYEIKPNTYNFELRGALRTNINQFLSWKTIPVLPSLFSSNMSLLFPKQAEASNFKSLPVVDSLLLEKEIEVCFEHRSMYVAKETN